MQIKNDPFNIKSPLYVFCFARNVTFGLSFNRDMGNIWRSDI